MRRWLIAALAALSVSAPAQASLALTWKSTPSAAAVEQAQHSRASLNGRVFDAVWNRVKNNYYDPAWNGVDWMAARQTYRPLALAATSDNELYRVLNQMLGLLHDAHASAQTPTLARFEAQRDEPRPLLGLQIKRDADRFVLEDVNPGSPAEAAEIEFGWEVRSFNGQPYVPGQQLAEGVPVTVEFVDATGTVRTVSITPQMMAAPVRRQARWVEAGVLLLSFDEFNRGTTTWIEQELGRAPPGTRLIIDLRGNRGGLIMEAYPFLSCFLPWNRFWGLHHGRGESDRRERIGFGCADFKGPLAVIVSGSSRSAAELTAGALQEAGRATIVGDKTAGAVLISVESRLPDGGRFNMSVEDVRLASGTRLEHLGVTPDIAAHTTLADRRAGRDPALDAAVAAVKAAPARPVLKPAPR